MNSAQPEDGLITGQSGAQTLVGYVVDVGRGDGCARAILDIGPTHSNRNGMLHGGIITMLLDAACGFTASMRLGEGAALTPLVTVSLNTNFVAGARIGSQVVAKGMASGGGKKLCHVYGEMHDDTGQLIATATGVFKKTPAERFT